MEAVTDAEVVNTVIRTPVDRYKPSAEYLVGKARELRAVTWVGAEVGEGVVDGQVVDGGVGDLVVVFAGVGGGDGEGVLAVI